MKIRLVPDEVSDGVVFEVLPTYLKVISNGEVYTAHQTQNKMHYPVGSKVEFVKLYHPHGAIKINKVLSGKSELTEMFKELYEPAHKVYIAYTIEEVLRVGMLRDFCEQNNLMYMGFVTFANKNRLLFKR